MRTKALISGALPLPWKGPLVELEDGTWTIVPNFNFEGKVVLEERSGKRRPLFLAPVEVHGPNRIRIEIMSRMETKELVQVTAELRIPV